MPVLVFWPCLRAEVALVSPKDGEMFETLTDAQLAVFTGAEQKGAARGSDPVGPSKGRKCFTDWNYFTKDPKLTPSGLLGPVVIRSVSETTKGGAK